MKFELTQIGIFDSLEDGFAIRIFPEYQKALMGICDFSYLQIIWWFDKCDTKECRAKLIEQKPYKKGPEILGSFATRTPERPNPIALSTVYVLSVDTEKGIIKIPYTDAMLGTPILDIKPYIPSVDRVEKPTMPDWCRHWPDSVETSGDFPWQDEFNF